jgi:glycine/D-amino acid oxidase-like deaminating enzyme
MARGDLTCDVVIIGAGFTGLRAALGIAEAGRDVVVLDAGDVGWGASGRNGGQVNPMLPYNSPADLERRLGAHYAARLSEVSLGSADALFDMIRRYQIECGARQNGWLRVNHCSAVAAQMWSNAQGWNAQGAEMEQVDGAALQALSGTRSYASGILVPKGGAVQPLSLARGLARVARSAGARIFGRSPVLGVARWGADWVVHCAEAQIRAGQVVLATNGYTGGLVPQLRRTILPLVTIQVATDPLPDQVIADVLPGGQTISDTRRVIMYARREPDNRMVFGGIGKKGLRGAITGHTALIRDAARVYPQLKGVRWRYRWGGQIAVTDDHLPHLHEPVPGVLAGLGYNGRGVAMSHVMGRVLAERALGADPRALDFPVTDMQPKAFRMTQMIGKGAAIRYWQLRDRLEMARG